MIISTTWLADYVRWDAPENELVRRLLMSGLNHESTWKVGNDTAIDIEVTSNRPDCLGHIGVAREVGVLFDRPLHLPDPRPLESGGVASDQIAVEIASADVCPHYTARVIRGVRVGPSPAWLADRLRTVGIEPVNNVVDITNYVMLECGQPLHAFDLGKVRGGRIMVRRARDGETFCAINHKAYALTSGMAVIADSQGPVALAGVMGGAESEIAVDTVEVLLESAQFAPLVVRAAARGLVLMSASSYRFERGPDPAAVDWASRRAAAMIQELAGGEVLSGVVTAGRLAGDQASIELGHGKVAEVLGIPVAAQRQRAILTGLGFVTEKACSEVCRWRAPSWRRDVTREIDLVEEIARIEGYDNVPEDRPIHAKPVELSARERMIRAAGEVLVAAGMCEAMTRSVVSEALEATASPWTVHPPRQLFPALVRGADRLRRSLVPSLLEACGHNRAVGAPHGELFEVARAYVDRAAASPAGDSPLEEPLLVALVTGGEYSRAKGLAEGVIRRLGVAVGPLAGGAVAVEFRAASFDLFTAGRTAEIVLVGAGPQPVRVGVVGEVAGPVLGRFGLEGGVSAAELRLDLLGFAIDGQQRLVAPSEFPAVQRDVNLVMERSVPWGDVERAIRGADSVAKLVEEIRLLQVWEDAERLGVGKKSMVVGLRLRSQSGTISSDDSKQFVDGIVAACGRDCGAILRS
ncbi:MAG: phenylalanine--tRNA ligase subunit beta [Planctomycetota bacterium]|nr:MAG: phenylalanine--tRNA ligase subunit beta [Planctomycetota bacterium]